MVVRLVNWLIKLLGGYTRAEWGKSQSEWRHTVQGLNAALDVRDLAIEKWRAQAENFLIREAFGNQMDWGPKQRELHTALLDAVDQTFTNFWKGVTVKQNDEFMRKP